MSFADTRQAIESRFAANFTALPVWYEGAPFDPPKTGYVRLTILGGDGAQISTGASPLHRYAGVIMIDVFMPEETGTATGWAHCDTIEAIFRKVQFSAGNSGTILCRTPSARTLPAESGWQPFQVSVPFQRDRIF